MTGTPGGSGLGLRLQGVTVRYGPVLAIEDVTIDLRAGEACGLVGMNGSGKSTLLKAVLGLVPLQSGSIEVLGGGVPPARRGGLLGYVPQLDDLDRDFPVAVADVVLMGRYHRMGWRRRPHPADRAAVDESLERVGLTSLAGRQIGRLSGGQRQRVLLARALAQEARVLLLDEPFTGVDAVSEAAVTAVLKELVADGCSVLLSTHDLAMLPDLCERSVLLHRQVLAQGRTADVVTPGNLARAFGLDLGGAR
jgi:manganese transport system ATP-binding protein